MNKTFIRLILLFSSVGYAENRALLSFDTICQQVPSFYVNGEDKCTTEEPVDSFIIEDKGDFLIYNAYLHYMDVKELTSAEDGSCSMTLEGSPADKVYRITEIAFATSEVCSSLKEGQLGVAMFLRKVSGSTATRVDSLR